jgi:hypothetical protein
VSLSLELRSYNYHVYHSFDTVLKVQVWISNVPSDHTPGTGMGTPEDEVNEVSTGGRWLPSTALHCTHPPKVAQTPPSENNLCSVRRESVLHSFSFLHP